MVADSNRVRRARAEEASSLAGLWSGARRASPGIPPAVHGDAEVRAWFRDVVLPSREVWVSVDGRQMRAMMVLDGEWVEQLYVAPEHLRRGHGSRLLARACATRDSLALWTFEANTPARAFYEARGFRRCGPPSSDNEERAPALCYRWRR